MLLAKQQIYHGRADIAMIGGPRVKGAVRFVGDKTRWGPNVGKIVIGSDES